jgi:hypothetical protein
MNILKIAIIMASVAGLSFAQIPSDTVKNRSGIKISKSLTFDHATVESDMEQVKSVFVPGSTLADTMDLKLNRSFKQELSSNVDKETIERMF